MSTYNGWKNYETWNVALWLGNDEGLYLMMQNFRSYKALAEELRELGLTETPDGVAYNDSGLDHEALDDLVNEGKEAATE